MKINSFFYLSSVHRHSAYYNSPKESNVKHSMRDGKNDDDIKEVANKGYNNNNTNHTSWDVDLYQENHSFVWEYGSSLLEILDPQEGQFILDIGCGSGELTNEIAQRIASTITTGNNDVDDSIIRNISGMVFGMDMDPNMIIRAKENFRTPFFFQGDVSNFSIPRMMTDYGNKKEDNTTPLLADAIFSNAALHWVHDAEDAIECMARALRPGGKFVVEFGGKRNVDKIVQATFKAKQQQQQGDNDDDGSFLTSTNSNPWYFPSIGEYTSLLEQHGIEVITAKLFDRPTVLEDGPDGLKNWLHMFGEKLLFIDNNDDENQNREVLTDELVDTIVDLLRPSSFINGSWIADYRRIRIVGRKEI